MNRFLVSLLFVFSHQALSEPVLLKCNTTDIESELKWLTPEPDKYIYEFLVDTENEEVLKAGGFYKSRSDDLYRASWKFTEKHIHILVSSKPSKVQFSEGLFSSDHEETVIDRFTLEYVTFQNINYDGSDTALARKMTNGSMKSTYRGQCKIMNKKL